jgi:uncharacterized DUF497 family protein
VSGFEYQFEWDPAKAAANIRKHDVTFETAATVLLDPLGVTIPDTKHTENDERWVTVGRARNGWLLVVIHTWQDLTANSARVRIISARRANHAETNDYEEGR